MSEKQCRHETFKDGAVRTVTEQGRPCRKVASELDICIGR